MPRIPAEEAREALAVHGVWRRAHEWRMSTVTTTEITQTGLPDNRAFKVHVDCDFVFEAHCPSVARAIEIAARYELLIQELWSELGWPGWATKTQLKTAPDAA